MNRLNRLQRYFWGYCGVFQFIFIAFLTQSTAGLSLKAVSPSLYMFSSFFRVSYHVFEVHSVLSPFAMETWSPGPGILSQYYIESYSMNHDDSIDRYWRISWLYMPFSSVVLGKNIQFEPIWPVWSGLTVEILPFEAFYYLRFNVSIRVYTCIIPSRYL